MALKTRYLQELSDIFVHDLKMSQYYRKLPARQRQQLDDQLAGEESGGTIRCSRAARKRHSRGFPQR